MLITDKKHFAMGAILTVTFFAVFLYMFTPNFGGENAFKASDRLFNSIAKGSTNYFPGLKELNQEHMGESFAVTLEMGNDKLAQNAATLMRENGMVAELQGKAVDVSGGLGKLMQAAVNDSEAMFYNRGDELSSRYGIEPREAMFAWWKVTVEMEKELKLQKHFAQASFVHEITAKGVEVGYNFYGIEPQDVKERWGIVTFALIFYVVYTMWWGYAIFFLAEGFGLVLSAGHKEET